MKFDVPYGRSSTGLRSGLIGIVSVLFSGMIGYHVIEGWRWLDGLYMTGKGVSR
ncbi:hypothetical protein [Tichowtungia aerotolerans]|uniref:Uncharacterized protein n=1 Tax=Tichowtungia aerotolerans TaxID=2697043 RepID=A0A6P1M6Y6_9BACT|nr:hypothetical protein [Tichowtungia aerotolerans]QHI69617.1 hypothetical protein GT409_09155 [Tichowtungia aerotolerans]